jgi:hypothetical protein
MSFLKSAWELSLEKSNKLVPKANQKLTEANKKEIAAIRNEFKAQIADKEITLQHKLNKLADRTPPERLAEEAEKLRKKFNEEKERLEKEMENQVARVHAKGKK